MAIVIKTPGGDEPSRKPIQTGPHTETDDGEIAESFTYPTCPHCGNGQQADRLSERDLNKCGYCGFWFYFRRIFEPIYVTCTKRRHVLN